jgi:hypothetical protein
MRRTSALCVSERIPNCSPVGRELPTMHRSGAAVMLALCDAAIQRPLVASSLVCSSAAAGKVKAAIAQAASVAVAVFMALSLRDCRA